MNPYDGIREVALEALEDGLTSYTELLALCIEETRLVQQADAERNEPFELLIHILEETDKVKVDEENDRVVFYPVLLEGMYLTHRLDADEIASGLVAATPDLLGIETDLDPIPLAAGGSARFQVNRDDGPKFHDHGSLEGPEGWLAGFVPGDLVAFERTREALKLEAVSEVGDPSKEVAALLAAFESLVGIPGMGAEPSEILLTSLGDDPSLFRLPLPPLEELLAEAGLEIDGAWAGPQGEEWKPPGVAHLDESTRQVELSFGMEPCCAEAFRVATGYWRDPDGADPVVAAKSLRHGPAADAFLDWYDRFLGIETPGFGEFLRDWIAGAGRHAAAVRYLYSVHLDTIGDAVSAEAEADTAARLDPEYAQAHWMLAGYASDRGDAVRTVSLLQRARVDPDNADLEFHRSLLAGQAEAGRNDPCPCGSGRKFKVCHLGKPLIAPQESIQWMLNKVDRYMHGHHRHDRYAGPAVAAATGLAGAFETDDLIRMLAEPFVFELAMFEGGGVADFIAERGDLLPADERDTFDLWTQATLALWEVVSVDDGTLDLRDTKSGERVEVFDRSSAGQFSGGDLILARPLPGFGTTWLSGVVIPIGLRQRETVLGILDEGADHDALAFWYGTLFRPPVLQTTEGEPLVFTEASLVPVRGWDDLKRLLDELYEADGDGAWRSMQGSGTDAGRVVTATLTREGDRLLVNTNAVERLDRVLSELNGEVEVVERTEREFDRDAPRPGAAAADPVDLDPDVLAEIIESFEERWLGESIPALGGLTPREAATDPTRLEDLEALLRMLGEPDPSGPGMAMRASRLRRRLGLEEE